MTLSIQSPDELIAVIPHLLGFKPEESIVFLPMRSDLPVARVDLPTTNRDRDFVWNSIRDAFNRYVQPGTSVGIVCITADRALAEDVGQEFAARLDTIGIDTRLVVWADETRWADLDTGDMGLQTEVARVRIAAATVLTGRAQPVASRDSLATSLVGDREPVAELLAETRVTARERTPRSTKAAGHSAGCNGFQRDGVRLSDTDAARLLVAVESIPTRDRLWLDMHVHPADDTEFLVRLHRDLVRDLEVGRGDPEPFQALLVEGDRSDEMRLLVELVKHQRSRSGFAVVSVGDAAPGDVVVELTQDGGLRIPAVGLDLVAAGLTSEEAGATAAIVDLTRDSAVVPMPREEGATGWRALADQAGALLPEYTEVRPAGEAGSESLLPDAPQRYEAVAPTTADDVVTLAPVVPEQTRRAVEETDPDLDADLADWHDSASTRPKLRLLGPVTVSAQNEPLSAVTERRAYFTELAIYLALHPDGVSSRHVGDAFGIKQSRARTDLASIREWFGTSARTGEQHLPAASTLQPTQRGASAAIS